MKILVIDGQGGKIGNALITKLKEGNINAEIYAVGTNTAATTSMLKAGADFGATGENSVIVASKQADIIAGPLGIILADSLLGEVTAKMAAAVSKSQAQKFLIPLNKCATFVIGVCDMSFSDYIDKTADEIFKLTHS